MKAAAMCVVGCACVMAGCGGGLGELVKPEATSANAALGEACDGSDAPLIVDWTPDARMDLELAMRNGVAVVSYKCGDHFEVLQDCRLQGSYEFAALTVREKTLQLKNTDEINANLSMGTASLSGGLEAGSALDIALIYVGQRSSTATGVNRRELEGDCEGATHYVRAAKVGAFSYGTGTVGKMRAAVEIFGQGTSGASSSSEAVKAQDGKPDACKQADPAAHEPPANCGAPIRLRLAALSDGIKKEKSDGKVAKPLDNPCPTGMVMSGDMCTAETGNHQCVPGDIAECAKQCDVGNLESCYNLGVSHKEGNGVEKSREKARQLFTKACSGDVGAACHWQGFYHWSDGTDRKDDGYAKSNEIWTKGCDLGDGDSCESLAIEYDEGGEYQDDYDKAAYWAKRGCDLGHGGSCSTLGYLHQAGRGVPKSPDKMLHYFYKACNGGYDTTCIDIAQAFTKGEHGVKKDPKKALDAYVIGCRFDVIHCEFAGELLTSKHFEKKDWAKARLYYDMACQDKGGGASCEAIGDMLNAGFISGESEPNEALEYYDLACKRDGNDGCGKAARIYESGALGQVDDTLAKKYYEWSCTRDYKKAACTKTGLPYEG